MNSLLKVLVFLITVSCFSQTYHFDTCYEFLNTQNNSIYSVFRNSENPEIKLITYNNPNEFILINKTNQKQFKIYFNEKSKKIDSINSVKYSESNYINPYVFQKTITDLGNNTFKIQVNAFYKKIQKKPSRVIEVYYTKSDQDILNSEINFFTHGTFLNTDFDFEKGIPYKIICNYIGINNVTTILHQTKTVNFDIELGKQ